MPIPQESELPPPLRPLPSISEATRLRLLQDLGLNISQKGREMLGQITGEDRGQIEFIQVMTNQVLGDLLSANRDFGVILNEELSNFQLHPTHTNARLMGMAVVLRAFDMDMDFDLLPRFEKLNQEDLGLARRAIRESLLPKDKEFTILERLLYAPRLPEQQVGLNDIVNKTARKTIVYENYSREGSVIMYRILSYLWDKLGSNGGQNAGNASDLPPQNG